MLCSLTYPRDKYDEENLNKRLITQLISKHRKNIVPQLKKNKEYYDGKHAISDKERENNAPNAKTVCNHAKDITDTASGYFMGNPITYDNTGEHDIEVLIKAFDVAEVDDTDNDNALMQSIYGVAYDYTYAVEGEAELMTRNLESENTFIVRDDSIEQKELFGVYYYIQKNSATNEEKYIATVCTENLIYNFELSTDYSEGPETIGENEGVAHNLGECPITEYKNNKFNIGDFEQQLGLIDAYNMLMADRVNDKEQFIDAILVIYGSILGDTEEESQEAHRKLKTDKLLEMDPDSRAEYLTRQLDETGAETLRKAIKEDIYTFSHIPNLTDENFSGNTSGVAMEYKLLGLEMVTKIKERYYRKGLRKRIRLFCNFLGLKAISVESDSIIPVFSRALPKNLVEIAQMIANLDGKVSTKTLIQLLPFVEDPDAEVENVKKEKEDNVEAQRRVFSVNENTAPEDTILKEEKDADIDG